MRIKICGITQVEDALMAYKLEAWAVGFNFYPKSPRYIEPQAAHKIIAQLPETLLPIGIFINQPLEEILEQKQRLGLSLLQVYENFSCAEEIKKSMVLVIQPKDFPDLPPIEILRQYAMVLIDAPIDSSGLKGGTGKLANWTIAQQLTKEVKLILAGGLNLNNVLPAITQVKPYALDLCSSIEQTAGKKDINAMRAFFEKATNVD